MEISKCTCDYDVEGSGFEAIHIQTNKTECPLHTLTTGSSVQIMGKSAFCGMTGTVLNINTEATLPIIVKFDSIGVILGQGVPFDFREVKLISE